MVMDGVGIGSLPDAAEYGQVQANTLAHICQTVKEFSLPNFRKLGLGNILELKGIPSVKTPKAFFGSIKPLTKENDSTPLHWEMMGIYNPNRLALFPQGLPLVVLEQFHKKTGCRCGGNIMSEHGDDLERLRTLSYSKREPAVYTTSDSVVQIIAHEKQINLEHLYYLAKTLKEILGESYNVGRVVAKVFSGKPGAFMRVEEKRKDFALAPPTNNFLLPSLQKNNFPVVGIGKINDFFSGVGITESYKTKDNAEGIDYVIAHLNEFENGLVFVNLLDFDTLGGHSNDPIVFAECLRQLDAKLPDILSLLKPSDLLIITADHGNDPTVETKTHDREYVPLLFVYPEKPSESCSLGVRTTFADIGATIAEWFGLEIEHGTSFLNAYPCTRC